MRVLKFRAWDNRYGGHMISWPEIRENMNFLVLNTEGIIATQYTGLKDKNGVEIYEGDIVKHWFAEPSLWEVVFGNGTFYLKLIKSPNKAEFDSLSIEAALGNEVIGNIYENPELLEG